MLRNIGFPELLLILAIIMLIFGTSKISGIGKSLGTAIRDFKDAMKSEPEKKSPGESPKESASEGVPKEAGKIK